MADQREPEASGPSAILTAPVEIFGHWDGDSTAFEVRDPAPEPEDDEVSKLSNHDPVPFQRTRRMMSPLDDNVCAICSPKPSRLPQDVPSLFVNGSKDTESVCSSVEDDDDMSGTQNTLLKDEGTIETFIQNENVPNNDDILVEREGSNMNQKSIALCLGMCGPIRKEDDKESKEQQHFLEDLQKVEDEIQKESDDSQRESLKDCSLASLTQEVTGNREHNVKAVATKIGAEDDTTGIEIVSSRINEDKRLTPEPLNTKCVETGIEIMNSPINEDKRLTPESLIKKCVEKEESVSDETRTHTKKKRLTSLFKRKSKPLILEGEGKGSVKSQVAASNVGTLSSTQSVKLLTRQECSLQEKKGQTCDEDDMKHSGVNQYSASEQNRSESIVKVFMLSEAPNEFEIMNSPQCSIGVTSDGELDSALDLQEIDTKESTADLRTSMKRVRLSTFFRRKPDEPEERRNSTNEIEILNSPKVNYESLTRASLPKDSGYDDSRSEQLSLESHNETESDITSIHPTESAEPARRVRVVPMIEGEIWGQGVNAVEILNYPTSIIASETSSSVFSALDDSERSRLQDSDEVKDDSTVEDVSVQVQIKRHRLASLFRRKRKEKPKQQRIRVIPVLKYSKSGDNVNFEILNSPCSDVNTEVLANDAKRFEEENDGAIVVETTSGDSIPPIRRAASFSCIPENSLLKDFEEALDDLLCFPQLAFDAAATEGETRYLKKAVNDVHPEVDTQSIPDEERHALKKHRMRKLFQRKRKGSRRKVRLISPTRQDQSRGKDTISADVALNSSFPLKRSHSWGGETPYSSAARDKTSTDNNMETMSVTRHKNTKRWRFPLRKSKGRKEKEAFYAVQESDSESDYCDLFPLNTLCDACDHPTTPAKGRKSIIEKLKWSSRDDHHARRTKRGKTMPPTRHRSAATIHKKAHGRSTEPKAIRMDEFDLVNYDDDHTPHHAQNHVLCCAVQICKAGETR